jgi:hypothetical protein
VTAAVAAAASVAESQLVVVGVPCMDLTKLATIRATEAAAAPEYVEISPLPC